MLLHFHVSRGIELLCRCFCTMDTPKDRNFTPYASCQSSSRTDADRHSRASYIYFNVKNKTLEKVSPSTSPIPFKQFSMHLKLEGFMEQSSHLE